MVDAVIADLGLDNATGVWGRAESLTDRPPFDFVVSRAVTRMPAFLDWVRPLVHGDHRHGVPNGVFYLKGGDLAEELASVREPITSWSLSPLLQDDFFETKQLLHVALG